MRELVSTGAQRVRMMVGMDTIARPTLGPSLMALVSPDDLKTLADAGWDFDRNSSGYPSFTRGDLVLTFYAQMNNEWAVRFYFDEDEVGFSPTISGAIANAVERAEQRITRFREELANLSPSAAPKESP